MIEEIWKNHSPKWPKNISRGFSHYVLSNGLNWVNINSLKYIDCGFVINFIGVYLVKAHSVSSTTPPPPPKFEVMKKLLRNRGFVKRRRVLLERRGFQTVSSVFLQKSMFSLLLEYFFLFLSGKYSFLL